MHQSLQNIELSKKIIQRYIGKFTTHNFAIDPKEILNYLLRKHLKYLENLPLATKLDNWLTGRDQINKHEQDFINLLIECKSEEVIGIINSYLERLFYALPVTNQQSTKMLLPHSNPLFALFVSYFYYFQDIYELNLEKNPYFKTNIIIPCHLAKKNYLKHYKKLAVMNEPVSDQINQSSPTPDLERTFSFKNVMDIYKNTEKKDVSVLYYITTQIIDLINNFSNRTTIQINVPTYYQLIDPKTQIYAFIRIEAVLNTACNRRYSTAFTYYMATVAMEYDATIQNNKIIMKATPILKDIQSKFARYLQNSDELIEAENKIKDDEGQNQKTLSDFFHSLKKDNIPPAPICKDIAKEIASYAFPIPTLKK